MVKSERRMSRINNVSKKSDNRTGNFYYSCYDGIEFLIKSLIKAKR